MVKLTKKQMVAKLLAIYDAIGGMVSESPDPFNGFYRHGCDKTATDTLCSDFEEVLTSLGVVFKDPEYVPASYESKDPCTGKPTGQIRWGILSNPADPQSWVLTGLYSKEEAEKCIREFCAA